MNRSAASSPEQGKCVGPVQWTSNATPPGRNVLSTCRPTRSISAAYEAVEHLGEQDEVEAVLRPLIRYPHRPNRTLRFEIRRHAALG